jgi:hypothetical protein
LVTTLYQLQKLLLLGEVVAKIINLKQMVWGTAMAYSKAIIHSASWKTEKNHEHAQ